jgi:hypothetical protein
MVGDGKLKEHACCKYSSNVCDALMKRVYGNTRFQKVFLAELMHRDTLNAMRVNKYGSHVLGGGLKASLLGGYRGDGLSRNDCHSLAKQIYVLSTSKINTSTKYTKSEAASEKRLVEIASNLLEKK